MTDLAAVGAIDEATFSDLQDLVTRRVREGMRLDFKLALGPLNDKARFELVKDVCAFANTEGGLLIYGVAQDAAGAISDLPGVAVDNEDALLNQLAAIIADNIEERIPNISIKVVRSGDENAYVLIRVPRSPLAPHMITLPVRHPRFYYRANTVNAPMTATQVKRASLLEGQREAKLLSAIEHLVATAPTAESSLHIFALPLYSESYALDISKESVIRQLTDVGGLLGGGQTGHTLAGFSLKYEGQSHKRYVLFMRDGGAVAFDSPLVAASESKARQVSLHVVERRCLQFVQALARARVAGLASLPILFAVRMAGVRGALYTGAYGFADGDGCNEDTVFPEPEVIHDWANADRALKRMFDVLWQAFGVAKSPNYDENGHRINQ